MASYTLNSANVEVSSGSEFIDGTFGETVGAGQPVSRSPTYFDSYGSGKFMLADANDADKYNVVGLAANSGSNDQRATVVTWDENYSHGLSGVSRGDVIIIGATPGSLHPYSDLASGWYPAVCMVAGSSVTAKIMPIVGTVAKA